MKTQDNTNLLPVITSAMPFQSSGVKLYINEGLSVADVVKIACPFKHISINANVYIDGEFIEQDKWKDIYPKQSSKMSINILPMGGGGGKNPLRTVLQIALIVAVAIIAPELAPSLVGSFGITSAATALSLTQFALFAVGSLIINAIAPPSLPRLDTSSGIKESQTRFIQGARNSLKRYGVVPVVLGKHILYPSLAAMTVTETIGSNQFARQLFTWGYGDLILTNRKIGQTLLTNFQEVETEDILDGSSATSTLNLYPKDVFEEGLNITLTNVLGFQTRTSQVNADEILVDITLPRGLLNIDASGNKTNATVDLEVETAITGSGIWSSPIPISLTDATSSAVRKSLRIQLPRNQYDVRIRRITADTISDKIFDDTIWTSIRTITNENPVNFKGISLTAIRIKATDQLNGAVDQLNAIVSNKIPSWNGSTWTIAETSNPADIFRYVASNNSFFGEGSVGPNAQPLSDNRVDITALQDWHDFCTTEGYEYNAVIDFETSVGDVLKEIAASGRASVAIKDGKWSVIIDRQQSSISQHFTPRNTSDYSTTKTFIKIPHAFRVIFLNEEIGYLQDERFVFDDGFDINNATLIEKLELPGITKPSLVWKHARQHLATLRLQPRTHEFLVDAEHLIAPRGSRCKFAHDVLNIGLSQGRIKSIQTSGANITGVILDEEVIMEASKSYGVVIRTIENTSITKPINTDINTTNTIVFQVPFDLATSDIQVGDLVMFGELGKETIDIIIKTILPESDLKAKVIAKDYNEAIFNASIGTIPAFNSGTTFPPELKEPVAPILATIQSDEEVQIRNSDGSISSRMVISLTNNNVGAIETIITFRKVGATDFSPAKVISATDSVVILEDFVDKNRYDFRIRYKRIGSVSGILNNIFSPALELNNVEFIGNSSPPPDITNFRINVIGSTALLKWDNVQTIDFDHYVIKFNINTLNPSWNNSAILDTNLKTNSLTTPLQQGVYLIKAIDRSGNESVNAIIATSNAQNQIFNTVQTLVEEPTFSGNKNNVVLNGSVLELIDNSLQGVYNFNNTIDLGQVFVSRLTQRIDAVGNNQTNLMSNWTSMSSVTNLSGTNPSAWSSTIEIRTTENDPNVSPIWSAWQQLFIGDIRFRAAQFRLIMSSSNVDVTPTVSSAQVQIAMPDRTVIFNDQNISVAGTSFVINPAFKQLKDVQVTSQNMQTGDYWTVTNKSPIGATIKFFDSNNIAKSMIADVQLNGFGTVQI